MQVLVISDEPERGRYLLSQVRASGLPCEDAQVSGRSTALARLHERRRQLVMVSLHPDPQSALSLLGAIAAASPAMLVATGSTDDSTLILQSLREGADEYLDEEELSAELATTLKRLFRRKKHHLCNGLAVGVLGAGGGTGASTLAANLGVVLAQQQGAALLCDCQSMTAGLSLMLGVTPKHSLTDLCRKWRQMDEVMLERALVRHASGLRLLAGPLEFEDTVESVSEPAQRIVSMAKDLFPHVLLDLDRAFLNVGAAALGGCCDLLLISMRLDLVSLNQAARMLESFSKQGVEESRVRVVVNRHHQPRELPLSKAERILGDRPFHCLPEDSAKVNAAHNSGTPVATAFPRSRYARSIGELAKQIQQERLQAGGFSTAEPGRRIAHFPLSPAAAG